MATANIGFEEKLWSMADKLRGSMDSAEYKHVVLGLLFLKYVSDAFEEKYEALKNEPYADPEDRDEYVAANIFWVPKEARWSHIKDNAKKPEIGQMVDNAMIVIEKENPSLKGVLPKDYVRPALDKTRLGEVIDLFSFKVGDQESRAKDVLGRVYDPCCGSGGMFVQSEKFVEEHQGRIGDIAVYGYRRGEILFIDARKMGHMIDRTHRELSDEDIRKIADTYHAWRGQQEAGECQYAKGFCKAAKLAEVQEHEYILTPGRYVGIEDVEEDGEPFEDKMTRLTAELAEQFAKFRQLEDEIRKRLGGIGFEF